MKANQNNRKTGYTVSSGKQNKFSNIDLIAPEEIAELCLLGCPDEEMEDLVREVPYIIKDLNESGIDLNFCRKVLDNLNDGVICTDKEQRILYWNQAAAKISGCEAADMLYKKHPHELLMMVDNKGNHAAGNECMLAKTLQDGHIYENEMFLHHRAGHRVPVYVRTAPIFAESGEIVGAAEILVNNYAFNTYLQQLEKFQENMLLDPLTGIGNRRYAELIIHRRLEELRRYPVTAFGILSVDIDGLKEINDKHGFPIGDQVLVMVAKTLEKNIRPFDTVCRWDGQRFLIVVIQVNAEELSSLAERMRMLIEWSYLHVGKDSNVKVTASLAGSMVLPSDSVRSLLARVDKLLAASKTVGKNRVSL